MRTSVAVAAMVVLGAACGGEQAGTYSLPADQAQTYETAYIATVVADPPGDDLERRGGEHLVIHNRHELLRADLGGWSVVNGAGERLPVPPSVQIDAGEELRLYSACGEDAAGLVFACRGEEFLADDGGLVRLLDSAGSEVARFRYGG